MTVVPPNRVRYLSDIAETIRGYHQETARLSQIASDADGLCRSLNVFNNTTVGMAQAFEPTAISSTDHPSRQAELCQMLVETYQQKLTELDAESLDLLRSIPKLKEAYKAEQHSYTVRGRD